ncbi:MAG TPA: hypothetical protein VFN23_18580 [Ktedonobacteraceae bacterium]|nr:hypothetical protein [Ktedonobacteraceae bacterium]
MAATRQTIKPDTARPEDARPLKKRRGLLIALTIILAAILLATWLEYNSPSNKTDPAIPGQPLSNRENHLHIIAQGAQPGSLYLGTHFGIFTSKDNGRSWPQPRGIMNQFMITSISYNPTQPSQMGIIALPTGSLGGKAGVYFSRDNGQNWQASQPTNLNGNVYPFSIRAGSGGPGNFYAFYVYAGWYETNDLGAHWHPITSSPLANMLTPSFLTDPTNPKHLLLGGDQGLFESLDDGSTWNQLSSVQGNVLSLVATPGSQSRPRTIYCSSDQGIYRWSDTKGSSPVQIKTRNFPNSSLARLTMDADGTTLYGFSGTDLWVSTDAAQSWSKRWSFSRLDLTTFIADRFHPGHLYAGFLTPGTVQESTDGGRNWHKLT